MTTKNKFIIENAPILLAGLFNSEIEKSKRIDVAVESASKLYDNLHQRGLFKVAKRKPTVEQKMSPERAKWFEQFWDAFNDKTRSSKKSARLVFSNMELNPELVKQIIYGAGQSYQKAKIEGLSFRKQAHSWLDAELYLGYATPPDKKIIESNNEIKELMQEIRHFENQSGTFAKTEVKRLKEKLAVLEGKND